MKLVLGAVVALLLGSAVLGVVAYGRLQAVEHERAAVMAAEQARSRQLAQQLREPELDTREELRVLQGRFDALQAEHEQVLDRLRELEGQQLRQPQPLPYASFPEAVAYWKALLADEGRGLSELDPLQAMTAQESTAGRS